MECCGVLLGHGDEVVGGVRTRNLSPDPNRFLIDPEDHIRARRDGRAQGLDVVGFYHSHPHSPAVPSETDRVEAAYPGSLYVIVSLLGVPEVRAFRLGASSLVELSVVAAP